MILWGVELSFVSVIIYSQTLRRCFEQVPVHDRSIRSERKIVLQNTIRKFGRVDANSVYTNCRSSMPKIRVRLQKTSGNLPLQYYDLLHTKLNNLSQLCMEIEEINHQFIFRDFLLQYTTKATFMTFYEIGLKTMFVLFVSLTVSVSLDSVILEFTGWGSRLENLLFIRLWEELNPTKHFRSPWMWEQIMKCF